MLGFVAPSKVSTKRFSIQHVKVNCRCGICNTIEKVLNKAAAFIWKKFESISFIGF